MLRIGKACPEISNFHLGVPMCANYMCQIVPIYANTCQVLRMCRVPGYVNMCQEVSNKQKEEPIKGLISREFIFFKRGMLDTLIGPNTCQVELCAKC